MTHVQIKIGAFGGEVIITREDTLRNISEPENDVVLRLLDEAVNILRPLYTTQPDGEARDLCGHEGVEGYTCTLDADHDGRHEAWGSSGPGGAYDGPLSSWGGDR